MTAKQAHRIVFTVLAGVALAASASGFAQASRQQAPQEPTLKSLKLTCGDFKHNQDGSWSTVHAVEWGTVGVPANVSFKPGITLNGVDIAAVLNKECTGH